MAKPRTQSASEIRPCKAIRLTEADLKRLDNHIEKSVLRLAERFGDCDGAIERMLDNFLADTRRWADEVTRVYERAHRRRGDMGTMSALEKRTQLTDFQLRDLRYIKFCMERGDRVQIGLVNMSVLRALAVRGLVNIVITPEGAAALGKQS